MVYREGYETWNTREEGQVSDKRYKPTVEVSTEWVFDITHAVGSLAQFFLTHGKGGDVKKEEALIEQGCEYLRTAEKQGGGE